MDHLVGFIDFGFLKAAAVPRLGAPTRQIRPAPASCVMWLEELAAELREPSVFLRAYWYDGAYDPGHEKHEAQRKFFNGIAKTPGIQLRLGHLQEIRVAKWHHPLKAALRKLGVDLEAFEEHFKFRPELTQKGVDTLITLDLVRLAQRHVFDTAVLIAGDRDLAEPVRVAQDEGRRVIVALPHSAGCATELRHLADEVLTISDETLQSMFDVIDAPAA
jgi:uncharacterized LabA/DUF88 family protein